jgi:exodeoxyribonuclease III
MNGLVGKIMKNKDNSGQGSTLSIISWNVNGLRAVHKKGALDWVSEAQPDILCLQETKSTPDQLPPELKDLPGYHSYFHFPTVKKGYSGVAIYSKEKPIKVTRDLGIEAYDQEGRLIMAEYGPPAGGFILINTYFPNGGGAPERLRYKLDFYDYFLEFVEKLRAKHDNIVFCGDVNVAHTPIDLARPKENVNHIGFLPIERAWMDKVVSRGWVDVFRYFFPTQEGAYTYWDMKSFARVRNVGWRIDYFFTTPEMLKRVKNVEILSDIIGSDHCPVKLTLKK